MAKQLLSIGNHFKGLIFDDTTQAAFTITDENGSGAAHENKALVGNAAGQYIPATISGYIGGPGSSTDNAAVRWDGAGGTDVQNSGVLIDDTDNVTIPGTITLGSGSHVLTNAAGLINGAKIQDLTIDPRAIAQDGATAGQALAWDTGAGQYVPTTLSGTIGGSTGGTDNRLLRADGAGGVTLQNSAILVDDSGNMSGVGTLNTRTIANWVDGPASSTDNAIARFDATTGKIVQNSTVILWDTGDLTGVNSIDVGGGYGATGSSFSSAGNISANGTLNIDGLSSLITDNRTDYTLVVGNIQNDTSGAALQFQAIKPASGEVIANIRNACRIRSWFDGANNDDCLMSLCGNDGAGVYFGILTIDSDNSGRVGILDESPSYVLDVNGTFRVVGNAKFDGQILFDDAHAMYIEPSGTTLNFGANSASTLTAAFGNAGAGTMNMTLDGALTVTGDIIGDDILANGDLNADNVFANQGNSYAGAAGTIRGVFTAYRGTSTNTPGCVLLYSKGGTAYYFFVTDAGVLRRHTSLPTADTDGTAV